MIVSGTLSFGLQAGAITFAVFCNFLVAIAWGFLVALLYSLVWCAYLIVLGYLFSHSYIQYTLSPEVYATTTTGAWIVVAISSCLTIILMLITAKQGFHYFKCLIEEIEQKKEEIELLANTDALTNFASGRLSVPMLKQTISLAERDNSQFAVIFMDLNNFKKINDTYGHDAGDYVLKETARLIRAVLREMDLTLRIGGDEFLFIFSKIKDTEEIKMILQRVIDTWASPISYENAEISISGSMGVAMYPKDAITPPRASSKSRCSNVLC